MESKSPVDPGALHSESDVEQKIVMPLLVADEPLGLGYPQANVFTKPDIRALKIGKGAESKLYYPDYVCVHSGIPVLVIEAKAPDESIEVGIREARLYAAELNASFPAGLNPLRFGLVTNGRELALIDWDSDKARVRINCTDLHPASEQYAELQRAVGSQALRKAATTVLAELTQQRYYRPLNLVGGTSVRNEEIGLNTFGANLALRYRTFFNPTTREDRKRVAREAYIPSRRRERYVEPIDRLIRAASPPSVTDGKLIHDTAKPTAVIHALRRPAELKNQILLIVGGVGAGKSTFVDHLEEVALPDTIRKTTTWVHLDMNSAPVTSSQIYDWVAKDVVAELHETDLDRDWDSLESLERVYAVELGRFKKGPLELLKKGSAQYNERLADELIRLQGDVQGTARAHVRHLVAERERLLVVVLDNCDKRVLDEQLLMFQVAQWIQKEFRALIILPLRDVTYDLHRGRPPLDTALKDLVFRIEPPMFSKVLSRRVTLVLKEMKNEGTDARMCRYTLANGMTVEYPEEDSAMYLACIQRSIFEYDKFVRRLIVGLAGRDLRRAMEMFLEICRSGHIDEREILNIRVNRGDYCLPYHIVTRVLLRQNRRFYGSPTV